ncbi:MAG: hypothetical protein ACKPKO_41215, partial [Candidatus Fonsibacter sp.]
WDDLKRIRQVVSEDTFRVVRDDLKRFKLSQNRSTSRQREYCLSGLGRPETFQVFPNRSTGRQQGHFSRGLGRPETIQVVPNCSTKRQQGHF